MNANNSNNTVTGTGGTVIGTGGIVTMAVTGTDKGRKSPVYNTNPNTTNTNTQFALPRGTSGPNSRRPSAAGSVTSVASATSMISMNSMNSHTTNKSNHSTNTRNAGTMSAKQYKKLKPREKDDYDRRRAKTTFTYVFVDICQYTVYLLCFIYYISNCIYTTI